MSKLRIILIPSCGQLRLAAHNHSVVSPCLLLVADDSAINLPTGCKVYCFSTGVLLSVYRELRHLTVASQQIVKFDAFLPVAASLDVLHAVDQLAKVDAEA
ncbi:hypothetical protein, partial [Paraburkholderia sp. RL17-373-BIF-A]|uniref:hypothetical protein n=1 Tax=Paraburkholderia sp. RL17-373-BIF-A TaxID=3031629 RepID=UPI0038B9CE91